MDSFAVTENQATQLTYSAQQVAYQSIPELARVLHLLVMNSQKIFAPSPAGIGNHVTVGRK